ncbi:MAG: cysteine desulfurase [Lachnospiraceae bacterium]|nr:cysteine desulfurase [Lachnospiraceae bacterium]
MKQYIYADNAATTKLDIDAFEAMKPYMLQEYGNVSQPYSFSRTTKVALKQAREDIAKCINAEPDEIYFTSGGTESDNWAIKGLMYYGYNRKVITSNIEHHAVLNTCKAIERLGGSVKYLSVNKKGIITQEVFLKELDVDQLASIMMINNEIGTIEPIAELARIAHKNGIIFHTDAVQAVGHIPIDVKELGVDMLSASAHKFNGPKGIGFLYIKKGTQLFPYNDGGKQEMGMRAGTENVASIVGMSVALQKNIATIKENENHIKCLEKIILDKLKDSDINFLRNGINHAPGNLSLSFMGCDGEVLLHRLDLTRIEISTGSACDSKNTQISHVLKAIELPIEYALGTVRISLGKNNTQEEAERIADELIKVINK